MPIGIMGSNSFGVPWRPSLTRMHCVLIALENNTTSLSCTPKQQQTREMHNGQYLVFNSVSEGRKQKYNRVLMLFPYANGKRYYP